MERKTIQLEKILTYLKGVKSHPQAEAVYDAVKADIPSITLATVYRNLHKLERMGLLRKIKANGGYRFDADMKSHQHCVCTACGGISDCHQENISKDALQKLDSSKFNASEVSIIFSGLCKKCSEEKK